LFTEPGDFLLVDLRTWRYRLPPSQYRPGRLICRTNKAVILSAKLSTPKIVNDLVYVRDPALAGYARSTLVVNFAKFKRQNEFRKSSESLGNQKLATLSANASLPQPK
jgi:hypothetical protein